jgi:hypothetical protein
MFMFGMYSEKNGAALSVFLSLVDNTNKMPKQQHHHKA